ncbi:MAG: nitroreductase/quinone reductase family protein [Anaerolineales bacterium]
MKKNFSRIGINLMKALLRSPLHGILSGSFALITVTGRKSGKQYTLPVNYFRQGDALLIFSLRSRVWWRNLRRDNAIVRMRLQGKDVSGWAAALEDEAQTAQALAIFFNSAPKYAKYFDVSLDERGKPSIADLARAAQTRIAIQVAVL